MAFQRRALASPVLAGLILLQSACSRAPEPTQEAAPTAAPAAAPAPSLPAPPPPLGRAELLDAVAKAASASAAGAVLPDDLSELAGRRLALRLPFGCFGDSPPGASLQFHYDARRRTLRLTATPEDWTDEPWVKGLVGSDQTEAIEAFWLRRPWLRAETCPVPVAAAPAPPAPEPGANSVGATQPPVAASASSESVGLVQVFERGGSRLLRRGDRPYEVTRRLDEDEAPQAGGFRLLVEGRIAATGAPIACRLEGPDIRPTCLVRVELDHVAFEDGSGDMLADWRP